MIGARAGTLTDNRHGLIASAMVTTADGHAEREAATVIVGDARQAKDDPAIEVTLGADKGYDAKEFIDALQEMQVTPPVAQNTAGRKSAVPDAIAGTVGYAISQQNTAKEKAHRARFWLGQDSGQHSSGDDAWN